MVEDVSINLKSWERKNQETVGRLLTLLVSIVAKGKQHLYASIRYSPSKDRLDVYQCTGVKMFPEDLYQKWQKDCNRDGIPSA